nr:prostaglandin E2 receptor EP3 subtype [Cavia porcellus]
MKEPRGDGGGAPFCTRLNHSDPGMWAPERSAEARSNLSRAPPGPGEDCGSVSVAFPITMMLTGFVGNALAMLLVSRSYRRRESKRKKSFLLCIGWLALTDLVGQLLTSPVVIVVYLSQQRWEQHDPSGRLCTFFGLTMTVFGLSSLFIASAMAVERALAIRAPHWYASHMKTRATRAVLLGVWLAGLAFALLPVLGVGQYTVQWPGTWCFISTARGGNGTGSSSAPNRGNLFFASTFAFAGAPGADGHVLPGRAGSRRAGNGDREELLRWPDAFGTLESHRGCSFRCPGRAPGALRAVYVQRALAMHRLVVRAKRLQIDHAHSGRGKTRDCQCVLFYRVKASKLHLPKSYTRDPGGHCKHHPLASSSRSQGPLPQSVESHFVPVRWRRFLHRAVCSPPQASLCAGGDCGLHPLPQPVPSFCCSLGRQRPLFSGIVKVARPLCSNFPGLAFLFPEDASWAGTAPPSSSQIMMLRMIFNQTSVEHCKTQTEKQKECHFFLIAVRLASLNQILDPWVYLLLRKILLRKFCQIRYHTNNYASRSSPLPRQWPSAWMWSDPLER